MILATIFIELVKSGKINRNPMPTNISTFHPGGKNFWDELAECNGWRLQKNILTGHCRILNPDNIRVAWGSEDTIMELLKKMKSSPEKRVFQGLFISEDGSRENASNNRIDQ